MSLQPLFDPRRAQWLAQALCAWTDPDAFFPRPGESGRAAQDTCRQCRVRSQCLAEALRLEDGLPRNDRFGIWGGVGPGVRHALAKRLESEAIAGERDAS